MTIEGVLTVPAGKSALLQANDSIVLKPNFHAMAGSGFHAKWTNEPNYEVDNDSTDFTYDAIGNLIADRREGTTIRWTPYGKVREVLKADGSQVSYCYDGAGNRVAKIIHRNDSTLTTHYVRDAFGNVLAIYQDSLLAEQPIYGSSRLGMYQGGRKTGERTLGQKNYELSNHLGNVLAVITDNINMDNDSVWATTVSLNDYYPFGLGMEGRSMRSSKYRYAFNGKEKDTDFQNNYDYGMRIYNPRLGRFLSVDPLTKDYPELTPYQFASNTPIWAIDLDGEEARMYTEIKGTGHTFLTVQDGDDIIVYTYGRYAGGDWYTGGATGKGVLVRYTGTQAENYLKTELYRMGAKAYEITDADQAEVRAALDKLYYSSNERQKSDNKDIRKYGRVVDDYNLFSNNCTTKSCDALKVGGSDIFDVDGLLFDYDEDFAIPSSLQDFLDSNQGSSIKDVTEDMKKQYSNNGKNALGSWVGSSGTTSGSSGDSSGSSANTSSSDGSSSGNNSGSSSGRDKD